MSENTEACHRNPTWNEFGHCWHGTAGCFTTTHSETSMRCCYCGQSKAIRNEHTPRVPVAHGPYAP